MGLGVSACGSGKTSTPSSESSSSCDVVVSSDMKVKPTVSIPGCAVKPSGLVIKDISPGTGAPAKAGDAVTVQYVGVSWSTKQQFDASWDSGQPFVVQPLGTAQVIAGWNQGLVGAKAGSRRLLIIPPQLGYGPQANGPIAANETLVFVVDVVSISTP